MTSVSHPKAPYPPEVFANAQQVSGLLVSARCVILDFDGPVCEVFAGLPAPEVAERLLDWIDKRGLCLDSDTEVSDPMQLLADASRKLSIAETKGLNELLTKQEFAAAATATATPRVEEVLRTASARGRALAIASNNADRAISRYVKRQGLAGYFGEHLHGRAADPALMKPHTDSVRRALDSTGARASEALMIGDSPTDFIAADSLGVSFLGFSRDRFRAADLRRLGARFVVQSWDLVLVSRWDM